MHALEHSMRAICLGLLCAKLLWNLSIPYVLTYRRLHSARQSGISMMPMVEITLLVMVACLANGDPPWITARFILLAGAAAIVGSYAYILVAGNLLGWWTARRSTANHKKETQDGP